MTQEIERSLSEWLAEETPSREPDGFADAVLQATARTRRRPGWLSPQYWLPMDAGVGIHGRMRIVFVAATLLLLAALVAGSLYVASQRTLPQPNGLAANGLLAFEREGDIWVVEADGSGERPLVASEAFEFGPAWSRDGARLAYWTAEAPWWDSIEGAQIGNTLMTVDADGANPMVLDEDVRYAFRGDWSPDGESMVYSAGLRMIVPPRLHLVGTDGSGSRQIGDPERDAWAPAFSPDGKFIAFGGGNRDGEYAAYVMAATGGEPTLVAPLDDSYAWWTSAKWTPDGNLLRTGDGRYGLKIEPGGARPNAAWSADGKRLAYVDESRLMAVNADGTDRRSVEGEWGPLEWSPDAALIVANSALVGETYRTGLMIVDPSGIRETVFIDADTETDFDWQRVAD